VSHCPDDLSVLAFGPRMVCTACGAIGAEARLNWNEIAPPSLFGWSAEKSPANKGGAVKGGNKKVDRSYAENREQAMAGFKTAWECSAT